MGFVIKKFGLTSLGQAGNIFIASLTIVAIIIVIFIVVVTGMIRSVVFMNMVATVCFAAAFLAGCDNLRIAGVTASYQRYV